MDSLKSFSRFVEELPKKGKKMPALFTSHGNPMDIPVPREKRPFWNDLFELGIKLQKGFEVEAVLIVSAHWCTRGTFVNINKEQEQIYDYYGFPEEYYKVQYHAHGAPQTAHEVKKIVPEAAETSDWGLDHGAWPMLMHLFPNADKPVFELSIDYYAKPEYHYRLGRQLKLLREKGILIIGSGALVHNLRLAGRKMADNDLTPYGWEAEYDMWIKKQLDERNVANILNYEFSHPLGKLAAPTPDHFVPVLYTMGLMDDKDEMSYFYESPSSLPAFSERSFIIY